MTQASTEKLEHTEPDEKERVASVPKRSWQERQSRSCQNEKKQKILSRVPDYERGESQGGQEPHLGEREGRSEKKHEKERVDFAVKESRFQGGKGRQARRASLGKV